MYLVTTKDAQGKGEEFRDEEGINDSKFSSWREGEDCQFFGPEFDIR